MKAIFRGGLLALPIMALAVSVNAGPFEDAKVAYDRDDYATAILLFRKAADLGNADAQVQVGDMYNIGMGLPQSYAEAAKWYQKAAEQGNADAQVSLGHMYAQGRGVPQDHAEAVKWFRPAAEQGVAPAQFYLGLSYEKGVRQDVARAAKWYRKAAEQGYAEAQFNLGNMYQKGRGVPQDYVLAHMWFNLDAAQGNKGSAGLRDDLARDMTLDQIAEAQRMAREWKAQHQQ